MSNTALFSDIKNLSPALRQEVENFVESLKVKYSEKSVLAKREFGYGKGTVVISNDFDEIPDGFKEYI